MRPEGTGFNPYDNNPSQKPVDIIEADLPPRSDEKVQQIRAALDEHRRGNEKGNEQGNDQRKAA